METCLVLPEVNRLRPTNGRRQTGSISHNLVLILALATIGPVTAMGQDSVLFDDSSPIGGIEIMGIREDTAELLMDVWLVDQNDTTQRFQLMAGSHLGKQFYFSPDEKWLACNDHWISNASTVELYKQVDGVRFIRADSNDISDKAMKFLVKREHLRKVPTFGHQYVSLERWRSSSKLFILSIDGYDEPSGLRVKNWTCMFNVETHTISPDKHNRGKVLSDKNYLGTPGDN